MSFWRKLVCVMCFFVDVHVHASPAISSGQNKKSFIEKGLTFSMDKEALAEFRDGGVIELVKGRFYVEMGSEKTLQTPFARLACLDHCTALLDRKLNRFEVISLGGPWRLQKAGDKESYAVPVAMSVTVTPVGTDGKAHSEIPQGLLWDKTVELWAHLFPGDWKAFKTKVSDFRPVWEQTVSDLSGLQNQMALRSIASHDEKMDRLKAQKEATEREDAHLRELFRKKNYLDQ